MLKHLRATDNGFGKKDVVSFPSMKRPFPDNNNEDPSKKFKKHDFSKSSSKLCYEEADDETLIRETQAALKNLSGNGSETRSTLYKSNDNEEDYPNLFDVSKESYQDYEISSNYNEMMHKLSNKRISGFDPIQHQQKMMSSAFKPISEGKKGDYRGYEATNDMPCFESNLVYHKPIDSPDSKQYTTLQPAGIGSRAASVLKDIVRDGVLSVSAVGSSLTDTVSSTTANDLQHEKENYQNKGNNNPF